MHVLVTGGYGFIGSHVAEVFFRKGHRVTIIDNLSTGSKTNVGFKHTFFQIDVEDPRCEEVFRIGRFDAVIHLAAQISVTRSVEDPCSDSRTNILGLVNMLRLSHKYNAKRFVFASSAAVYGNSGELPLTEDAEPDIQSPYGMSKLVGEAYCQKWNELYGLNTVVLRLSNVFGPRQRVSGEGGVVSAFIENLIDQEELVIFGDGNQTRDFIYVKDVADAIYQAVLSDVTGVFNLSSNTERSISELVQTIGGLHPIKGLQYRAPKIGDINRSCLDNTKIREALAWSCNHTLEEGLEKTLKWYLDDREKRGSGERGSQISKRLSRTSPIGSIMSVLLPYIENLAMFALAYVLTAVTPVNNTVNALTPDFMTVYIVLTGVVHGIRQSALASVLASASLYYLHSGGDILSLFSDTSPLLKMSFYVVVGIAVGYIIEVKNDRLRETHGVLQKLREQYASLEILQEQTRTVAEELRDQIICSEDSYGKVYSLIEALDHASVREILPKTVKILEDITRSDTVSIYHLIDGNSFAILAATSDKGGFAAPTTLEVRDRQDIQQVIETRDVFINKDLSPMLAMMAAPLVYSDQVVAVALIHSVPLERLTLHHYNRLKAVVGIISRFVGRASEYARDVTEEHLSTFQGS
ncbi:MAG: NAD-dependent epimerase/dehydratase family protein [Bacillota bacterium]|jgi:UDP-glucuronate decarboxylase